MRAFIALALSLVLSVVTGNVITSFEIDYSKGIVYAAGADCYLYEIDAATATQTHQHFLNYSIQSTYPATMSAHVATVNGQKSYYSIFSTVFSIYTFDQPFGNKQVLQPAAISGSAVGFTGVPAQFDDEDQFVLSVTNGKVLNLFDLKTVALKDSVTVFELGNPPVPKLTTSLLYNTVTNRALVFWYIFNQQVHNYDLQVSEYHVANNKLTAVATTFPTGSSDFNNTNLVSVSFDKANNHYWGLDPISVRLVQFNADNLNKYTFIPLGNLQFKNTGDPGAVFNFPAQLAYVISSYGNSGIHLSEVDMVKGHIRRSKSFDTNGAPNGVGIADVLDGNLYIGLLDFTSTNSSNVAVINLNSFAFNLLTLKQSQ